MTSTEIFESVTNGGSTDFAAVVEILNRHGRWCLIGGLAVNCYVEPVFTVDADIVVTSAALAEVQRDLTEAGFDLSQHEHSVNAHMKSSELRIQFTTDARYQDFLVETERRSVLGTTAQVASLANVVRGKAWKWSDSKRRLSKRKKDELDLIRIAEKYPKLQELMPAEIIDQLRAN